MNTTHATTAQPKVIELSAHDLPAHCPSAHMQTWNNHPLVYLSFDHGVATCPYCSTQYRLKAGEKTVAH